MTIGLSSFSELLVKTHHPRERPFLVQEGVILACRFISMIGINNHMGFILMNSFIVMQI